jgi:RHS repeat-associated protein
MLRHRVQSASATDLGRTNSAVTSGSSSASVTYTIDAFGRTATRTASGVTTTYRYAGEAETLVTETTGSTTTKYAHSPGGPLARKVGTAAAQVFIRDLHGDAVGRLATSATDMAAATWFSPWGEPVELESTPAVLGFQGQLTEHATGAVDMTTRYYLPELGRFTTRDVLFGGPRKPMSLNQFIYTEANPMSHWDPTGMGGPGVGLGCGLDCKQEEEDRMDTLENPGGGGSGTSGTSPSGHDEDATGPTEQPRTGPDAWQDEYRRMLDAGAVDWDALFDIALAEACPGGRVLCNVPLTYEERMAVQEIESLAMASTEARYPLEGCGFGGFKCVEISAAVPVLGPLSVKMGFHSSAGESLGLGFGAGVNVGYRRPPDSALTTSWEACAGLCVGSTRETNLNSGAGTTKSGVRGAGFGLSGGGIRVSLWYGYEFYPSRL